jgi:hypothetical protein
VAYAAPRDASNAAVEDNAQAETAAALGQLQARLAVVEKILKDVE